LFSRQAGCPRIASVLVQDHGNDLSARVALEVELRVDNIEKEPVLAARENREGGLPGDLCFEMITLKPEIDYGASASAAVLLRMTTPCRPLAVNPRKLL
jgi:hypothetical protein